MLLYLRYVIREHGPDGIAGASAAVSDSDYLQVFSQCQTQALRVANKNQPLPGFPVVQAVPRR
jgi:hypothetical protein